MNRKIIDILTKKWLPGCYGMKYPFVISSADGFIFRQTEKGIEVLTAERAEDMDHQPGMIMLAHGGMIDPGDDSPPQAALREIHEEILGIKVHIYPDSFCDSGPAKFSYYWNPVTQQAVKKNKLAQDVPVATFCYLAEWVEGEPKPSKESINIKWVILEELKNTRRTYAFNHAFVLEKAIQELENYGIF
jgi:8-oxo-dGTP pyrophosphatase MutT (NUDIX family)